MLDIARRRDRLADDLRRAQPRSPETLDRILEAMHDGQPRLLAHARRVAASALAIARALPLPELACQHVHRAALVHDIGKLAFPTSLIDKDGQFTSEELAVIRTHTVAGAAILINVPYLQAAATVVAATHERWAGGGFPRGLFNDAIPMPSRIIAVADAFDALTGHVRRRRPRGPRRGQRRTGALRRLPLRSGGGPRLAARARAGTGRMLIIVGSVIVLAAVLGGFLMAGGALGVLVQPSEFVVIGGAAAGSLLISTPPKIVKMLMGQITAAFGSGPTQADYVDLLAMQYQIFKLIQQSGVMALEAHFEDPAKSPLLSRYPKFLARHEAVDFLADSAKVIIVGGIAAHDLEALMDEDLRVHHEDALKPSATLSHHRRRAARASASSPPCSASSSRWATSTRRRPRSATTSAPRSSARSSAFCMSYGFVAPLAGNLAQRVNEEQVLQPVHQGGPAGRLQGPPADDRDRVRAPRAAARRAAVVQRDRAVLPCRGSRQVRGRGGRLGRPGRASPA